MALYQNGILISGANKLPQMTYAEWQALPAAERPSEWICTDRSYSDLPASDVAYDNTDSGLSADNVQDAIDEVAQSGGSGGHVIQDASGTAVAQEPTMQFSDAHVSDDSTNEKTIIENIKSVASADYSSETEDGLYLIPDGDGSVIGPASEDYVEVTADGDKTYAQLFAELWTKIDTSKVTGGAILSLDRSNSYSALYTLRSATSSAVSFVKVNANTSNPYVTIEMVYISANFNALRISNPSSYSDAESNAKPTQGTVITLYYGNKKAVVDLQTTANRCWYDSNTTVKQKLDQLTDDIIIVTDTVSLGALSSGASGYKEASIQIPTGYTSIMATVNHTSPSVLGGDLLLNVSVSGSTAYIMYRTFASISSANSTVRVRVLCKKS